MHFFFVRLRNALFHAVIASVRTIQSRMIRHFFTSIGHPQIQLERVEAGHIFYAGRAEFLAEPIRPISNRIKHFGCAYCRDPKEYIVPIPAPPAAVKAKLTAKKNCDGELTPNWPTFPPTNWSLPNGTKSVQWREWQPSTESHTRPGNHHHYETIRREFPQLNWAELERNPFVLVSFGSIAKIEFMPSLLLLQFLRAFSRFPGLLFVWQTNSDPEVIRSLLGHSNRSAPEMPGNVRLHRWVPIKTLLAHPKLRYAILHGGINTVNEALIYAGKPVLGLPLQGDQPSNLQRLVDLGMAELVDIAGVWRGQLGPKMALLEQNYAEYARRASRVSAMVESYRKGLGGGQQNFWLRWTANKRLLLKRSGSRFFGLFYRSSTEHFAMVELGSALALLATICAILSR